MVNFRHAARMLGALLCTGAVAVAATGCGSTEATLDPIAQAADATTHAGGSQVAMTMTISTSASSSPISIKANGDFNLSNQEGQLDFSLEGLPASNPANGASFTELYSKGDLYMRSSLFEGKLPNGAKWMKVDLASVLSSAGFDPSQLTGGENPAGYLQYLRAGGASVKAVGSETIRGVATTRYDGSIDLRKAAEVAPSSDRAQLRRTMEGLIQKTGASSFPVSVWIDAHHLLRRMEMSVAVPGAGGSANIEIEYFGFGATSAVSPPPASETFDATQISKQALFPSG